MEEDSRITSPSWPVVTSVPPETSRGARVSPSSLASAPSRFRCTAVHSTYSVLPPMDVQASPVTTPGGVVS